MSCNILDTLKLVPDVANFSKSFRNDTSNPAHGFGEMLKIWKSPSWHQEAVLQHFEQMEVASKNFLFFPNFFRHDAHNGS